MTRQCNKCNGRLKLLQQTCSNCGATNPVITDTQQDDIPTRSQQCDYQHNGERCPLPGAHGNKQGSARYCDYHLMHRTYPEQARDDLKKIISGEIQYEKKKDWRDEMIDQMILDKIRGAA